MAYRYIVLVGSVDRSAGIEAALARIGVPRRFASGRMTLFASEETPILAVPEGILVGDLFRKYGVSLDDTTRLPQLPSRAQFRRFVLEECWGDYLLIQPETENEAGPIFLRDPSPGGDLSCLYSFVEGNGFVASDISLPTRLGLYRKSVDWDSVAHCLACPHLKLERTGLAGIRELLPGCALRIEGTETSTAQAWSPWKFVSRGNRHTEPQEATREVRKAVQSVISSWAAVHDSILLELSGGLDSSIVGACLRDTPAHVACCTLTTSVPGADERVYAGLAAEALGAKLHIAELRLEDAQFTFAPPAPTVSPRIGLLQHATNLVMEAVADRLGVDAFFSGSGGDTAFCYLATAAPAADAFRERGLRAGAAAVQDLSELHQCTLWSAGRLSLLKLLRAPKAPCSRDVSFLPPGMIPPLWQDHPWFAAPAGALAGDRERICDLAGNQIFRDSSSRGIRRRLRMPLLSQPVVEACLRAPSWMWFVGGRNRAIARLAFADKLPREILNRRSKGHFVGYLGAAYRRNKSRMLEFLLDGELSARGMLDADALRRYAGSIPAPRDRSFMRILDLCMIENWVRQQS